MYETQTTYNQISIELQIKVNVPQIVQNWLILSSSYMKLNLIHWRQQSDVLTTWPRHPQHSYMVNCFFGYLCILQYIMNMFCHHTQCSKQGTELVLITRSYLNARVEFCKCTITNVKKKIILFRREEFQDVWCIFYSQIWVPLHSDSAQ